MNKENLKDKEPVVDEPEFEVQDEGEADKVVQPIDYVAKFDKLFADFKKIGGASEECRAYLNQACKALIGAAGTIKDQGGYNNDGVIGEFLALLA